MLLFLPGLAPFAIFEIMRKFLYAQSVQWPPLPAACVGLLSHALWLELTTRALGALYLGAATLYLRGGRAACAALAALLLLPCAAAGVRCCKRRRVPAEQF